MGAMPGHIIITDLPEESAYNLARNVARDLEFDVERDDDFAFTAGKGNLLVSILLGCFIAYCRFEVDIVRGKYDGEVEISISRNNPWWTGLIGIGRVKKRAKELADEIADAIEEDGGKVIKVRDF
jgi:hypothetical protein